MSLIFEEWVNAAGYTPMLNRRSQSIFGKHRGSETAKAIQEAGLKDPLLTVAPNHLRSPLMDPYALDHAEHINMPPIMCEAIPYNHAHISHSFHRHGIYDEVSNDLPHIVDLRRYLQFKNNNPIWDKIRYESVVELKETLESIKDVFVGYDKEIKNCVAQWLCDTFMTINRDYNSKKFISTGFFGVALGIGAEYDLKKIKNMIKELNPRAAGVENNVVAAQNYIKNSRLYKELSATNRYLATSCMLNEYFNKSDSSRTDKYMMPRNGYIDCLNRLANRRNSITPAEHAQYMNDIAVLYYNATNVSDKNRYVSPKDERFIHTIFERVKINNPLKTQ